MRAADATPAFTSANPEAPLLYQMAQSRRSILRTYAPFRLSVAVTREPTPPLLRLQLATSLVRLSCLVGCCGEPDPLEAMAVNR